MAEITVFYGDKSIRNEVLNILSSDKFKKFNFVLIPGNINNPNTILSTDKLDERIEELCQIALQD